MNEILLERLRERLQSGPTVDVEICPPIRINPPVTIAEVVEAESRLGFPLPPLIRELYTRIGDGGWGPGYGLNRLMRGRSMTLVLSYLDFRRTSALGDPPCDWPDLFLELVPWGCNFFSGIDCSRRTCPVIRYISDRAVAGATTLGECLVPEADSLAEWLSAWVAGEQLWERAKT
jgi:hypothetical protein